MPAKQIFRIATVAVALTIAAASAPVLAAATAGVNAEPFISLPTLVLSACALTCGVLLFALTRKLQTIPQE